MRAVSVHLFLTQPHPLIPGGKPHKPSSQMQYHSKKLNQCWQPAQKRNQHRSSHFIALSVEEQITSWIHQVIQDFRNPRTKPFTSLNLKCCLSCAVKTFSFEFQPEKNMQDTNRTLYRSLRACREFFFLVIESKIVAHQVFKQKCHT